MVAVLHATRFAQTGVPDDATMPSFEPFGRRAPQMGGCHVHRVPDIADLSFGWSGFGIFDAVEAFASEYGNIKNRYFFTNYRKKQGPFSLCISDSHDIPQKHWNIGSLLNVYCTNINSSMVHIF